VVKKMGKITKEMVLYAYDVGKNVFFRNQSRIDGGLQIAQATGMDAGSAQDYITVLLSMLDGKCYKRTINMFATDYYLRKIGIDFGVDRQRLAARASLDHVQYYREIKGYLSGIEKIAKKYLP
jgi:hypothetical protein